MPVNIDVLAGVAEREGRTKRAINRTATAQTRAQTGAHLYVIRSEAGFLKIGRSNGPQKRLASLQGGSAVKLKLVKILRGRGHEERQVHGEIAQWRRSGEWFHDTHECRLKIRAVLGVEIRFRQECEEESDAKQARIEREMDIATQKWIAKTKQKAEKEMAPRIAAGLAAYEKGRPITDNPYTRWALRSAWDKGWRSGCDRDAQ